MNSEKLNAAYFKSMAGIIMILVLASLLFANIPPPANWLVEWTNWFLSIAAVGTAVRGFWIITIAAAEKLSR